VPGVNFTDFFKPNNNNNNKKNLDCGSRSFETVNYFYLSTLTSKHDFVKTKKSVL